MRKRLLALVLSVFMLANAAASVLAESTSSNAEGTNGVSVEFQDLGENFGKSPARKLTSKKTDEKDPVVTEKQYSDDEVVRVSIVLEAESTLDKYNTENIAKNKKAVSYRNSLRNKQDKIVSAIEKKGISVNVKWNLTLAANMISVEVAYGDIESIRNIDGVKSVVIENRYEVAEDDVNTAVSTSEMIFAQNAWAAGYTGAGSLVAIVDTGTNQDHISFDPAALEYSLTKDGKSLDSYDLLTKEDITAVLTQLNAYERVKTANADSLYKNLKIPYAFNYVDRNFTTDHDSDAQGEHGSHVSGIAAANRYVKVNGEFTDAVEAVGAVGVAPDAQIITMKVFGAGGGAYDSDYMVAIEDAIILGADSVNLSLGSGSSGYAFSNGYQEIMDKLTETSTVVVMSAGNAYSWMDTPYDEDHPAGYLYGDDVNFGTSGSPGTFFNTLSVASADNIGMVTNPLVFNGEHTVAFTESSGYANPAIATVAGTYDYVYIDGVGETAEYEAVNAVIPLAGKVVMVNRGGISFYVKGDNAVAYNPKAVVVVNNQDGIINMDLSSLVNPIPMVSITLAAGEQIKEESTSTTVGDYTVYTGKVEITEKKVPVVEKEYYNASMSDYSSWGGLGALLIKPEITAPGGNIWSVNGMTDGEYEIMSGTSMAAPHVTGMAALMGQYVRESGIDKKANMSRRAVINALLMSTSTPLYEDEYYYYSVLKQGAGLANVFAAATAKSVITVNEDATMSYADGKVKVELGEDKDRTGKYNYSFNIQNTSDETILYFLATDIFTQYYVSGYLSKETDYPIDYDVTYDTDWGFDVNKDGMTDTADVQAILDLVTGKADAEKKDYDKVVADVDFDGKITSYDAELLLTYLGLDIVAVKPNEKKTVKVTIEIENKDEIDEVYVNGCYIEGYTYVVCVSSDEEGIFTDVDYSFPILGYYGSWTDPSMYDKSKVVELCYNEVEYYPYFDELITNYIGLITPNQPGVTAFTGNPYATEAVKPLDRFAISGKTEIANVTYQLIRPTVAVMPYVASIDGNGNRTIVSNGKVNAYQGAPYYYVNKPEWRDVGSTVAKIGGTVKDLGFADGDKVEIGLVAIPEYYAMKANNNKANTLTEEQIDSMIVNDELGEGAYIRYQMTVDSVAPEMISCVLNEEEKTITVVAKDNRYIAYIGLMDMSGSDILAGGIPEQTEPGQQVTYTIDISDLELGNACVVFIGDYAANEVYKVAILHDGPITIKTDVYKLTNKLEAGKEYVIADINKAGTANIINSPGYGYYNSPAGVTTVISENGNTYIKANAVTDADVWNTLSAPDGVTFASKDNGYYMSVMGNIQRTATYNIPSVFTYDASYSALKSDTYYLFYYPSFGYYITYTSALAKTYIYVKDTIETEVDPRVATKVEVEPVKATLILGVKDELQATATVYPVYLEDRTVTWTSTDENVATVDAKGLVHAVGVGSTVIRATSNNTNTVYGEATISVVSDTPVNRTVKAMVNTANGAQFVTVDLKDMSITKLADAPTYLVGGGRGGSFVRGQDADTEFWKFDVTNSYASEDLFAMNPTYAPIDASTWANLYGTLPDSGYDYEIVGVTSGGLFCIYDNETGLTYFDLSSLGETFVAVCYAGTTEEKEGLCNWYYMLTEDSEIYYFYIFIDESDGTVGLSGDLDVINTVDALTVSDKLENYSMTYAGDEAVFIADANLNAVYYVELDWSGDPVTATYCGKIDNITGISSLHNDDWDAITVGTAAVGDSKEGFIKHDAQLHSVTVNLVEKIEEVEPEYAEEVVGTTESVKDYTVTARPVAAVTANNVVAPIPVVTTNMTVKFKADTTANEITYTTEEDELIFSGKITVNYDKDAAEFVEAVSGSDFYSVYDDGNGTVTFAFCNEYNVEGDVVTFKFKTDCEDSDVKLNVAELNYDLEYNDSTDGKLTGIGHDYKFTEFEWNDDHTAAKAVFVCENNPEHVFKLDAKIEEEITPATTEEEGLRVVTATVEFDGETYIDTYRETLNIIPDTGDHSSAKLWLSLTALTFAAGTVLFLKKKRRLTFILN